MVGNVHLTTHRLLFHAPLPPDEAFVRKYTSTGEPGEIPAFDQPVKSTDLLHSGPVTWHRSGPLVSAQRVWLELSAEMLSTYPSADDVGRTRPLKSILREYPSALCRAGTVKRLWRSNTSESEQTKKDSADP